ncbi:MAG: hypothetical protein ACLPV8_07505 [Steroidobacteraceae bacterium]
MKSCVVMLVAAIFWFCLQSVFLLRTAEAQITTGKLTCTGDLVQLPNGLFGCSQTLPVRHLGKGGAGSGNPRDYGMCGILGMAMEVEEQLPWKDAVQIVVDASGFYKLQIGVLPKSGKPPTAQWTCVNFWGFTGVPPISDGFGLTPAPFSSSTSPSSVLISGSAGDACIWAGFEGDLAGSPKPGSFGLAEGGASAQYYRPETKLGAQSATTYAFCSGYTVSPSWKWHFLYNSGVSTSTPRNLGINEKDFWCYMDLIQDDISGFGPIYSVSAQINISGTGDYSLGGIFLSGDNSVSMGYNCLPLAQ